MKAFQINNYGDNSVIEQIETQVPQLSSNQVMVELKASSINPVDFKIRSGYLAAMLPKTFPFTLGWEGAGIITEVGSEVQNYKPGDEVIIMPNFMQGGTYAEYVSVNDNEVMLKPTSLDFAKAAVLPFSLGTAHTALIQDANIAQGQKIFIHGAGGAVGQMAVQIAKNKGLYVVGTASGTSIDELKTLGIDEVIDYTTTDFTTATKDLDVFLDLVGGDTLTKALPLMKKGGVIISTTQPPNAQELDKFEVIGKMTQTKFSAHLFSELNYWIENGNIRVKQPQIFSFDQAKEALSMVEQRKAKSKIVLEF